MSVTFGRNAQISSVLVELHALDAQGRDALRCAVDRIHDEPLTRDTVMSFEADLDRHLRELEVAIRSYGGAPGARPRRRPDLVRDAAAFDAPTTTAVLRVLKQNEDEIVRRYQVALADLRAPAPVLDLVRRCRNDSLRHRAWIAARVDAFSRTSRPAPGERDSRTSVV